MGGREGGREEGRKEGVSEGRGIVEVRVNDSDRER